MFTYLFITFISVCFLQFTAKYLSKGFCYRCNNYSSRCKVWWDLHSNLHYNNSHAFPLKYLEKQINKLSPKISSLSKAYRLLSIFINMIFSYWSDIEFIGLYIKASIIPSHTSNSGCAMTVSHQQRCSELLHWSSLLRWDIFSSSAHLQHLFYAKQTIKQNTNIVFQVQGC